MDSTNFFVVAIVALILISLTMIFGFRSVQNIEHISNVKNYNEIISTIKEQINYLYPQANGSVSAFSLPLTEGEIVCFLNKKDYNSLKELDSSYIFLLNKIEEDPSTKFPNIIFTLPNNERHTSISLLYIPHSFCITKPTQKIYFVNYGDIIYIYNNID